ncbi:endonuclease/exonuclease/phosphatase family protein [Niabella hibiscisoli]|uniref:endonuclease/exonuclease/phosphatase family protein n=1 Tax=Niabella hibiscisoli TaxID=1825928 RepID=UPI001F0E70F7|nr:endonuclease/exonuclease/phosphatase family protein [Niabella hibiscisoli]MCH5720020.1 twin-arginine translocation signal domain-containing protein [Niabella hibiscisoli]
MSHTRRKFIQQLGAATVSASLLPYSSPATSIRLKQGFHRVLSCNIRVALPEDEAKGEGWPQRKDICIEVIKNQQPDIVGFQEVLKVQAEDIRKAFPVLACSVLRVPRWMPIQPAIMALLKIRYYLIKSDMSY